VVAKRQRRQRGKSGSRRIRWYHVTAILVLLVISGVVAAYYYSAANPPRTSSKPIIMYVNQGNGAVNGSNFGKMLGFAQSDGFNTVFFQVYRRGDLLFSTQQLQTFVTQSHEKGVKIFFALFITNSSQPLPTSIYGLGEDGISLDMSTLDLASQQTYLSNMMGAYHGGESAVTTTDMTSPLQPDLLVLETYASVDQQFIKHGIIASVGVFATSSEQDYKSQFQYALQNSGGVMVFDYAGLIKHGY
jgi:hypothetical protein